jgi:hypothetical protein
MIRVIPKNDIKDHDEYSTTCACDPSVFFENGEMIVVHNAFDRRQDIEEGGMEGEIYPATPKE